MRKVTPTSSRKLDHIRINLEEDVESGISTGFKRFRFTHRAIPEIDLEDIDLSLELFSRMMKAPLLISSMTGGTQKAAEINRILATAAQETGIAIGLGSQRAAIENPELASSYQIRKYAPDILIFANLGAIQINYGYGLDQCKQAVEMVEADGLILHFNALQEALQPEGNTNFAGLLKKIEMVCEKLPVPVIAKEVGWGFSGIDAKSLSNAGVEVIDVAGAGGTSWSQVEMYRSKNESQSRLAASFIDWGIPTSESIIVVHEAVPELFIFASGGIRSGIDIAKSLALGATLGGMAGPFLKAASVSLEETTKTINEIIRELQICMFAAGIKNLFELTETTLIGNVE